MSLQRLINELADTERCSCSTERPTEGMAQAARDRTLEQPADPGLHLAADSLRQAGLPGRVIVLTRNARERIETIHLVAAEAAASLRRARCPVAIEQAS